MTFYLAPSLVALRDEVNAAFPKRDKTSDGWIGDTSHSARPSDHNPDWSDGGVVRAIDIDIDDSDPTRDLRTELLNALLGDERVYYVISNGIIYSRTYGWAAHKYTGSNDHSHHVHVSIRSDVEFAETSTADWLDKNKRRTRPLPVDLSQVREQFLTAREHPRKVEKNASVRRVQCVLRARYDKSLETDGFAGAATLRAYALHEKSIGIRGGMRIPDAKTLPRLLRDRYRMVA